MPHQLANNRHGLQISNLTVTLEDSTKKILDQVNLEIPAGQVHALMGPNGGGKSSLALALAGHPDYLVDSKSSLKLNGQEITSLTPDKRAQIGLFLAFQHPIAVSGVTVRQILRALHEARFGEIGRGENPQFANLLEFNHYLEDRSHQLGIEPSFLRRNLNEGFSGGERKRMEMLQLAIAAPLAAILDETDSGLDVDSLKTVASQTGKILLQNKTTTLIITHYDHILQFIKPDKIHILINGRIVKSGGQNLLNIIQKNGYKQWLEN